MSKRFTQTFVWMPTLFLLLSVSGNLLQARKILALVDPSVPRHSRVGTAVQPIELIAPNGDRRTLRFNERQPTLLYFFSPTCAWCERNWDNLRTLAAASSGRFRVVAVARETDLREFVGSHQLPGIDVNGGLSSEAYYALALSSTPHTLLVSAEGIVSHDWVGAYQGTAVREIEDLFDISLPGVRPAVPPNRRQPK